MSTPSGPPVRRRASRARAAWLLHRQNITLAAVGLALFTAACLLLGAALLTHGSPWPWLAAAGACYGASSIIYIASTRRRRP